MYVVTTTLYQNVSILSIWYLATYVCDSLFGSLPLQKLSLSLTLAISYFYRVLVLNCVRTPYSKFSSWFQLERNWVSKFLCFSLSKVFSVSMLVYGVHSHLHAHTFVMRLAWQKFMYSPSPACQVMHATCTSTHVNTPRRWAWCNSHRVVQCSTSLHAVNTCILPTLFEFSPSIDQWVESLMCRTTVLLYPSL